MSGGPLSREAIKAMPQSERVARADELAAWVAAGARDGEPAPLLDSPLPQTITRAQVKAMPEAERVRRAPELARMLAEGRITA